MQNVNKLIELLNKSHSQFHVVNNIKEELLSAGFKEIKENQKFEINKGESYFITRNDSSIIAFKVPKEIKDFHFQITAAHNDSPTFKLKQQPVVKVNNTYSLNVEPYGGMIMSTWLDRPLSIAGRVFVKKHNAVESILFDKDENLMLIPNVAIHMNREVNTGYKFNAAVDMLPLLTSTNKDITLNDILDMDDEIIAHDLFLYNRDKAELFGLEKEFLSSPRIDDLGSTYSCLMGLINSKSNGAIDVLAAFDNEEVGSLTRQGANSTFLKDTLRRITKSLDYDCDDFYQAVAKSSLLSVDNAHAVNPNHPEYSDKTKVLLNQGVVIKYNANQSYTTDALSSSIVKTIMQNNHLNIQEFSNRSDLRGGSTLGNISNSEISIVSADIGLPQLAMHSCNEMCGVKDIKDMLILISDYYSTNIIVDKNKVTFNK